VEDYKRNTDDTTAIDNMLAIESFYKLFPEYKYNDFFITGESYGGSEYGASAVACHISVGLH